uniref:Uncharacterized protein n=1 Tax=Xenopus tropicalis TaxID=8364 RepID=A0A1B8Y3W5_XENTR
MVRHSPPPLERSYYTTGFSPHISAVSASTNVSAKVQKLLALVDKPFFRSLKIGVSKNH